MRPPLLLLLLMMSNKVVNCHHFSLIYIERLRGLVGSALDYISLLPEFESWRGHTWRVFQLWLRFIIFAGRSTYLAYHVHKRDRNTSIINHHFNICIGDFSLTSIKNNIACRLGGRLINHIAYADVLCILSSSSCWM